ncbi:hypothetical protein LIER_27249 [Lithospermum erythrorhizon]|uniref:Uncharacterized protein n=1 Tax=Lithospermum erythrorhizon TaxID=34254 RepID=A0AAV3REM1_LITER
MEEITILKTFNINLDGAEPIRRRNLLRNKRRKLNELNENESSLDDMPRGEMIDDDVDFSTNNLTGNVPLTIGNLKNVEQIELYQNSLSGELPDTFSGLRKLRMLDACQNTAGKIPESLAALHLESLNLNDNFLEGEIPGILAYNQ